VADFHPNRQETIKALRHNALYGHNRAAAIDTLIDFVAVPAEVGDLFEQAVRLRNKLYNHAEAGSLQEGWANQLGNVLGQLRNKVRFD
jgi:hypothetical protein